MIQRVNDWLLHDYWVITWRPISKFLSHWNPASREYISIHCTLCSKGTVRVISSNLSGNDGKLDLQLQLYPWNMIKNVKDTVVFMTRKVPNSDKFSSLLTAKKCRETAKANKQWMYNSYLMTKLLWEQQIGQCHLCMKVYLKLRLKFL